MSKQETQITLWAGAIDDHPTWKFFQEEIARIYHDLNTERDRAYVDYELIKRAAKCAYVNNLEEQARSFLMEFAKLNYPQAQAMVERISSDIGRVEMKREVIHA